MKKLWKAAGTILRRISLVDRFLMLFLFLLFAYMAWNLLTGKLSGGSETIDVIVRTSAATIFGYFLSGNSLNSAGASSQNGSSPGVKRSSPSQETGPKGMGIGFQAPSQAEQPAEGGRAAVSPSPEPPKTSCDRLQVWVVSAVGLVSLVILLAVKGYQDVPQELAAAVSQLRDFLFACIGFLVSCGKSARKTVR